MNQDDHILPSPTIISDEVWIHPPVAGDDDIGAGLDAIPPKTSALKLEVFRKHFDRIDAAIARQSSVADILAFLKTKGLALSRNTFHSHLDRIRQERGLPPLPRKKHAGLHQTSKKSDGNPTEPSNNDNQEARHD